MSDGRSFQEAADDSPKVRALVVMHNASTLDYDHCEDEDEALFKLPVDMPEPVIKIICGCSEHLEKVMVFY
jgi:hypothetical protein